MKLQSLFVARSMDITSPMHGAIERFRQLYQTLDAETATADRLAEVYHSGMRFEDSFHAIVGLTNFSHYCQSLYENLLHCQFEFEEVFVSGQSAMLTWTINFQHPRLNKGQMITTAGVSRLLIEDGKVSYHRDYFDGGALLYEHIPFLGKVIKKVKKGMVS